ncbi:hypothetical protein SKAU_G00210500 [Synaphobranchus kaupii]|uniref:Retrotransposon gag domain-containing protein n=1 Tax=Synaphobranchus kaupii TaxID=118154 RepID=A0A9Q1F8U1_SYNKA|nr:hypothetical protein SKAU_G00210500 [Synaphobranchus kaupii]
MDSADSSQLKSVLAWQGVLLGQFQQIQLRREVTLSNPVPAPQASGAREWGMVVWDARSPVCSSHAPFTEEMKRVFDHSWQGHEAAQEMLQIRQGRNTVSDYAIDFRTLAATTS